MKLLFESVQVFIIYKLMIIYQPLQNISSNPMFFLVAESGIELLEWAEQPGVAQIFR